MSGGAERPAEADKEVSGAWRSNVRLLTADNNSLVLNICRDGLCSALRRPQTTSDMVQQRRSRLTQI